LKLNDTCPLDRKELGKVKELSLGERRERREREKKEREGGGEEEEEGDEVDGMFG